MKAFYQTLLKARQGQDQENYINNDSLDLERLAVETASTQEAVTLIIQIQELKRSVAEWANLMKTFNSGQQLLQRQRFSFPSDWLYYDMLEGEWSAFNEILTRKSDSLGSQIPLLQRKIIEEEKIIDQKIKDLASDWNQNKPLGGNIKYTTALDTLKMFEGRISKLKTEYERLIKVTNFHNGDNESLG